MEQTLQDKIWKGEYGKAVLEAEGAFKRGEMGRGELSSVYYSVSTSARAEGNRERAKKFLHLAVEQSDQYVGEKKDLTADELDVRQSILRAEGREEDARQCIEEALRMPGIKAHTRGLLLTGNMDMAMAGGADSAELQSLADEVESIAENTKDNEPRQTIRLYRGLVRFYRKAGDREKAEGFAGRALKLIEETGAAGEREKLEHDRNS